MSPKLKSFPFLLVDIIRYPHRRSRLLLMSYRCDHLWVSDIDTMNIDGNKTLPTIRKCGPDRLWDVKKDFKLSIIKCLQVFNNGIGVMHVVFYFIDYRYMKEEEVYVVAPKFKMLNAFHTGLFIVFLISLLSSL